jgi:hypothetical protein
MEVNVDVLPATPKNLTAFCERFERQLDSEFFEYHHGMPLQFLYDTRQPALAALAWRIMERYPDGWFNWRLFELAGEHSESVEAAEAHFLKLADDPRFESRTTLFWYWGDWEKPLSRAAFATLLKSERLWTRVLTYVHFSKRCDQAWIDTLLSDLNDLPKPIATDRLMSLLCDLESERFAVREKAMAQLAGYGERAEAQMRQALQGSLPAEAKRRLRHLLEDIESGKAAPEWKPIVKHLLRRKGPEARAVLTTLSKGTPEAALTQAAKAALQDRARLFPRER